MRAGEHVELVYYDSMGRLNRLENITDELQKTGLECGRLKHLPKPHHEHDEWLTVYLVFDPDFIVKVQGPFDNYKQLITQADSYLGQGKTDLKNGFEGLLLPEAIKKMRSKSIQSRPPQVIFPYTQPHSDKKWLAVYLPIEDNLQVKVQGAVSNYTQVFTQADWYRQMGRVEMDSVDVFEGLDDVDVSDV